MGIDPRIWGPSGWRFLHLVCLGAPEVLSAEDQKHYADFLLQVAHVLPCGQCRTHYKENLQKHPLTAEVLATRASLFAWSVDMHNEVNKMHGKQIITPAEAYELLLGNAPPSPSQPSPLSGPSWVYVTFIILLLLALLALVGYSRMRS